MKHCGKKYKIPADDVERERSSCLAKVKGWYWGEYIVRATVWLICRWQLRVLCLLARLHGDFTVLTYDTFSHDR